MHENEPSPSNQPEHVTSEQIPHSGIHHDERPVDEFDNTPLPEAAERGLVNSTPDTPADLEQPESAESTDKKSHKKLIIGGAAFLAGAAVIAGSVIGIKAASDAPKNTPPAPDPKATSQTPEATAAPTGNAEVLTVKSLEISTGETPEQLGTAFVQDRFSKWEMAGANDSGLAALANANYSTAGYIIPEANKNATTFGDALFVPGYRSDPRLSGFVFTDQAKSNAHSFELWSMTYKSGDPADLEAYNRGLTVESTKVVSQDANSLTIAVAATEHDNADKNRAGTTYASSFIGGPVDGNKILITLTLRQVNGTEKISAMTIGGR